MKNWRHSKLDKLAKREKFRKSKSKIADEENILESEFIKEETSWDELYKEGLFAARIVEVHKRYAFVSTEPSPLDIQTHDVWLASIARKYTQSQRKERNFFAVGDKVLCRPGSQEGSVVSEDLPSCIIEHRAPRASKIARLDPMTSEREHVLASNLSQLIIVASFVYPKVKWGLIDRYLVLAEEQGIKATIILNKKDLLQEQKPEFIEDCKEYMKIYSQLGYQVLTTCAENPSAEEKEEIQKLFHKAISMVSGHSGVGKSSLVNLLRPEISQEVESEDILTKGRHTTTYASFIKLGTGGYVIDTPGIRSFLLETRSSIDLSWSFVEMRPYLNKCKYRECKHLDEPECAVTAAVKAGHISERRYKSYVAILTGASGREGRLRDVDI
ncbi:MAG: ribosome small subunit-dependent GTPase A [Oligoflexales bacterium]|nr:ribosome small subunit-dependent GTPase A [Oligoflexales bacterium]